MQTESHPQQDSRTDQPYLMEDSGLVRMPFKALMADPHGMFRSARSLGPVAGFSDGSAMMLRAADVQRMFGDPRIRQIGVEGMQAAGVAEGPFLDWARETLLLSHGRDHVRRRTPLARAFAYPLMNMLRPSIRRAAHRLVADWTPGEALDLRDSFAITVLTSTVSLTPGTVSADVSEDRTRLLVHALHVEDPQALVAEIKQRYEGPIKEIFEC